MGELTEPADIPGFLANVPLLAGFGPEALDELARRSSTTAAAPGDVVVRQGEPGDALYIVITGQVRVVSDVPAERVLLAHLGPGEFFGERSLLTGEPRNAAVVADVESTLLSLSREVFEECVSANTASSRHLSRVAAIRERPAAQRFHNEATSLLAIPANGGRFVIGTGEDCDIRVPAPGVAGHHAALVVEAGVCTVVDLGSGNGTYLNQEPIHEARLNEGDSLRLGGARLFLLDGVLKLFVSRRGVLVQTRLLRRTVRRDGRVLLNDISLTIHPGELVAIVGPSGAGKTTLLRTLVGLTAPTSGTVTYDGRDLQTDLDRFRHHLGYVPQYDTLHLELSVDRSLHYAGRLRLPRSTSGADLDSRIERLLDVLHLAERADTPVGRLSGGQRKRTCVAAELLSNPGILCLDEPTSGLDPGLDLQLMQQLRELADDGRTVILTTHATRNIRICDRVVILCDGELVFDGAPTEALAHFSVDDFVEVYSALAATPAADLADGYARSALAAARGTEDAIVALAPPGAGAASHDTPPSTLYQLPQLLSRDARVLLADRVSTALRLFGAPLLGVLVAATFDRDIFALERAQGGNSQQAITLLYLAAAICLFLGAFTSANVITRERGIYQRERLVNLSPIAYVLSKAAVLSLFSILQGFLFIAVLAVKVDFPGGLQTVLALGGALAVVSLAGMGMGLLISALSGNADRAAILVVLALIPQLIFAGSTVPRSEMTPVSKAISDITITKWTLELTGSVTDLDGRLAAQSVQTVSTPGGPVVVPAAVRPFENAFKVDERARWLVLGGFCLLFLSGTVLAQSRKR
jgi:ABC-type multidrug transport system ATPase subunit/ABC-type multidrug transport system permease subunit